MNFVIILFMLIAVPGEKPEQAATVMPDLPTCLEQVAKKLATMAPLVSEGIMVQAGCVIHPGSKNSKADTE